jgi:hypothetical protein
MIVVRRRRGMMQVIKKITQSCLTVAVTVFAHHSHCHGRVLARKTN